MVGRPEFKPTREQREDVVILTAQKTSEKDIAVALGIDEKTLRKHFRDELDTGFIKFNAVILIKIGRKLMAEPKKADYEWWFNRIAVAAPTDQPQPDSVVRPSDIGKKAMRVVAAAQAGAGSDWEDDLRPPPATVN